MLLVMGPDLENTSGMLKNKGSIRRTQATVVTPNSEFKSGHIFFYIINLAIIAGCSVAFVWDIFPHEQLSKNPRIFLSLEGVTPLQQRTSTLITYCHCFSWTHEDAVEDCPCTCGHALTYQALTDPSTFWSSALTSRSELYYSFFPFTFPHVPIFSLKHTHYAKIIEPRGVQVINHTLCQNQPDSGFWAIRVGPND